MPRKESMAVPEENGSIPLYVMPGEVTLDRLRQVMSDIRGELLREIKEDLRQLDQRLAGLEHDARQPRPAMEPDGLADTKTLKHTEGAATIVQAMHGDSCSANRVDPHPMCSTSFGEDCAGLPAPPCSRDDALIDNGAAAPKSCLSPL